MGERSDAFAIGARGALVHLKTAAERRAQRPKPWGVCYTPPNPDGSSKVCGNCITFVPDNTACVLHDHNTQVTKEHVCGYHVFGAPLRKWMDFERKQPLDPKLSGLELVRGGTSCNTCRHYVGDDARGSCRIVQDDKGNDAEVEGMGCCAAWEEDG